MSCTIPTRPDDIFTRESSRWTLDECISVEGWLEATIFCRAAGTWSLAEWQDVIQWLPAKNMRARFAKVMAEWSSRPEIVEEWFQDFCIKFVLIARGEIHSFDAADLFSKSISLAEDGLKAATKIEHREWLSEIIQISSAGLESAAQKETEPAAFRDAFKKLEQRAQIAHMDARTIEGEKAVAKVFWQITQHAKEGHGLKGIRKYDPASGGRSFPNYAAHAFYQFLWDRYKKWKREEERRQEPPTDGSGEVIEDWFDDITGGQTERPCNELAKAEAAKILQNCLLQLSERDREIFVNYRHQNRINSGEDNSAALAEKYGMTREAVRAAVKRAKPKLRNCLKTYEINGGNRR